MVTPPLPHRAHRQHLAPSNVPPSNSGLLVPGTIYTVLAHYFFGTRLLRSCQHTACAVSGVLTTSVGYQRNSPRLLVGTKLFKPQQKRLRLHSCALQPTCTAAVFGREPCSITHKHVYRRDTVQSQDSSCERQNEYATLFWLGVGHASSV